MPVPNLMSHSDSHLDVSRLPAIEESSRPRIAFLYNHDATHQVAHSASFISALIEQYPGIDITLLATSDQLIDAIISICGSAITQQCRVIKLEVPGWHGPLLRAADSIMPLSRIDYLVHNAKLLGSFDALVVTERTSLLLKRMDSCKHLKLLYISHGSGDRSIGFKADMADFDLILLSGQKLRDRFLKLGNIPDHKIKVVGYSKFDAVKARGSESKNLFPEPRPIVLYNPHHEPWLSSWYDMGYQILDYFLASKDYNLIFAPHVMMFRRRFHLSLERAALRFRRDLPQKYTGVPHMLIDTGSPACTDMTYTNAADIYLGDASSQVYEFLSKPKPCVHINSHGAHWQGDPNYFFWTFGPVITQSSGLDSALRAAVDDHQKFRSVQEKAIAETFAAGGKTASVRSALVIGEFLGY